MKNKSSHAYLATTLLALVLFTACSSTPSVAAAQTAYEQANASFNNYGRGATKVVGFKKIDGQASEIFGIEEYEMRFEATLKCTAAQGCCRWVFAGCNSMVGNDETYTTTGSIRFRKSEKGWSVVR